MPRKSSLQTASQDFVPIKEIKDGVVVLEDGTLVSVSLVTSINISLKSVDEQDAIINSFQAFLNLLEFQTQIVVQSRRLDIRPYIEILENRLGQQTNELIKIQTVEYISFIKSFTESVNVMDKSFFLVVSYQPVIDTEGLKSGIFSFLGSKKNTKKDDNMDQRNFEESRNQLEQRMNLVSMGLRRTGVKIKSLDTEALIELYYSIFNPGEDIANGSDFIKNKK